MLEDEVGVEQDRLDLRQQRIVLIDVAPARLDHADLRIGLEVAAASAAGNRCGGTKSASKMAMNSAGRLFQSRFEGARLVARAVDTMDVVDVEAARRVAANRQFGDFRRLVGRIVEHLNLEEFPRIVHLADGVDQPIGDVHLVKDWQLDCDRRQHRLAAAAAWRPVLVFHVKIDKVVAVPSVDRQNAEDEEVNDEDECLRQRHREMNPSVDPIDDFTARLNAKSTNGKRLRAMNRLQLRALLNEVQSGTTTPEAAHERLLQFLRQAPYEDLGFARVDHHRHLRQGFPEVIFGAGKTPGQVAAIAERIVSAGHSLLVTRTDSAAYAAVREKLPDAEFHEAARSITLRVGEVPRGRGTIAIAAAGTADLPVAEEAAVAAEIMGNCTDRICRCRGRRPSSSACRAPPPHDCTRGHRRRGHGRRAAECRRGTRRRPR